VTALGKILFFDTETRSTAPHPFNDVTIVNSPAYFNAGARTILFPYAFGDGEPQIIENWDGIRYADLPHEVRVHYNAASQRGYQHAVFATFNAGFDRPAWTHGIASAPRMHPRYMIDVMAQAVASNLPPSLEMASKAVGGPGKHEEGKRLIKLFCAGGDATPATHPDDWALFKQYALEDVIEMQRVYYSTLPLQLDEWKEYWASEVINETGMPIDLAFAQRAAAVAEANKARSNRRLKEMTNGEVEKVTQVARMIDWVVPRLAAHPEAYDFLTKAVREDPESEGDFVVVKRGLSRDRIENILTYFLAYEEKMDGLTDEEIEVCDLLEIRQWDGSAAPAKFAKMLLQQVNGRLYNSYVFNGAGQTGRFSSRGVQVHNLPNRFIGLESKQPDLEAQAIERINELRV